VSKSRFIPSQGVVYDWVSVASGRQSDVSGKGSGDHVAGTGDGPRQVSRNGTRDTARGSTRAGGPPSIASSPRMPGHGRVQEPDLAFHPDREEDRSPHPLVGLLRYGPYSRSLLGAVLDPIRVAIIAPAGGLPAMDGLLRELEREHAPRERKAYLRPFPGFSRVFGVRLVTSPVRVELPEAVNREVAASARPHILLADRLMRAINYAAARRHDFDVMLIYLPDRWTAGFYGPEGDAFDLHDALKAFTAVRDIPVQFVREDSALAYYCRCSVAWRLGIALYCKAGGVPWKLAAADPGVAYIGLSYALRAPAPPTTSQPPFVTCCSQVFDADGTGLEFVAYAPENVNDVRVEAGVNPFLSRAEMRRVMARSLALYQRRHAGQIPRRVVVHKTTEFKDDEIEGCFDALRASEGIDLVRVQQDTPWRGVVLQPTGRGDDRLVEPGGYPVERGTYLPLGARDALLWTQGDAPDAVNGQHYFKEGKGIPTPLLVQRFAGHGGWDETVRGVLGLTKMDWNSDSLYARLPVTLGFAQTLARVLSRLEPIGGRAFAFRFFM
jgi:hypothetical protein